MGKRREPRRERVAGGSGERQPEQGPEGGGALSNRRVCVVTEAVRPESPRGQITQGLRGHWKDLAFDSETGNHCGVLYRAWT